MIFSNLRRDNRWSRDNFSNQITDADEACRSSEISVVDHTVTENKVYYTHV
jgi:hypothetical protein